MKKNILLKVLSLIFSLLMVVFGIRFFSSSDFKKDLNALFASTHKTYIWCPDHAIDFTWLEPQISEKWKQASSSEIQKRFCELTLEPLQNIDLSKISFKPLLIVQSVEAKTAQLDWSSESSVFQVNGLPFYSPSLGREILDK
jgi:hypothetical protein